MTATPVDDQNLLGQFERWYARKENDVKALLLSFHEEWLRSLLSQSLRGERIQLHQRYRDSVIIKDLLFRGLNAEAALLWRRLLGDAQMAVEAREFIFNTDNIDNIQLDNNDIHDYFTDCSRDPYNYQMPYISPVWVPDTELEQYLGDDEAVHYDFYARKRQLKAFHEQACKADEQVLLRQYDQTLDKQQKFQVVLDHKREMERLMRASGKRATQQAKSERDSLRRGPTSPRINLSSHHRPSSTQPRSPRNSQAQAGPSNARSSYPTIRTSRVQIHDDNHPTFPIFIENADSSDEEMDSKTEFGDTGHATAASSGSQYQLSVSSISPSHSGSWATVDSGSFARFSLSSAHHSSPRATVDSRSLTFSPSSNRPTGGPTIGSGTLNRMSRSSHPSGLSSWDSMETESDLATDAASTLIGDDDDAESDEDTWSQDYSNVSSGSTVYARASPQTRSDSWGMGNNRSSAETPPWMRWAREAQSHGYRVPIASASAFHYT